MKRKVKEIKVAVVGSGPAAWVAIRNMVSRDQNFEIFVITPEDNTDTSIEDSRSAKRGLEGYSAYDFEKFNHLNLEKEIFEGLSASKTIGGFSTVWGASLDDLDDGSKFSLNEEENWITCISAPIHFSHIGKMDDEEYNISTSDGILALNLHKCLQSRRCILGCRNSAIWSTRNQILALENLGKIKVIRNFVEKIYFNKSPSILLDNSEIVEFDKVILAPGPLGLARILAASDSGINSFSLSDSATTFFAAIKFRRLNSNDWLSLHHFRINLSTRHFNSQIQVYPNSSHLKETAMRNNGPLIQFLVSKFWKILSPILLTGILYLPDSHSHSMKIRRELNSSEKFSLHISGEMNEIQESSVAFCIRALFRNMLHLGFVVLPFGIKNPGIGAGFHSGSLQFDWHQNKRLRANEYFALKKQEHNVLAIGNSELTSVDAGPITSKMMRQSESAVNEFLDKITLE